MVKAPLEQRSPARSSPHPATTPPHQGRAHGLAQSPAKRNLAPSGPNWLTRCLHRALGSITWDSSYSWPCPFFPPPPAPMHPFWQGPRLITPVPSTLAGTELAFHHDLLIGASSCNRASGPSSQFQTFSASGKAWNSPCDFSTSTRFYNTRLKPFRGKKDRPAKAGQAGQRVRHPGPRPAEEAAGRFLSSWDWDSRSPARAPHGPQHRKLLIKCQINQLARGAARPGGCSQPLIDGSA